MTELYFSIIRNYLNIHKKFDESMFISFWRAQNFNTDLAHSR